MELLPSPTRILAMMLVCLITTTLAWAAGDWNNVKALMPGTEVRLEASGQNASRGRLASVTNDSVVLTTAKGQETFARQQVARISQKKNGHRGRNVLIGAAVGAGAGLGIGAAASSCSHFCVVSPGLVRGGGAALGAAAGALIGAVIPTGGWKEIYKQ